MVKAKPTFLNLFGQRRQAFINRGPVTEVLQANRLALAKCFLQMEPPFVVHIMIEIDIHTGSRIIYKEPARLGQFKPLRILIYDNSTYAKRSLHQHLHGVDRQLGLLCHFLYGHSLFTVTQHIKYSKLQHQA